MAVFLVIKIAYDMLWMDGLSVKLQIYGIQGRMYNWIREYSGQGWGKSEFVPIADGLVLVEEWSHNWDFQISAVKTQVGLFGWKRGLGELGFSLYGSPLVRGAQYQFLGILSKEKMTWMVMNLLRFF